MRAQPCRARGSCGQNRRGVRLQLVVIGGLRRRLGIDELAPVMRVILSFFNEVDIVVDDGTREAGGDVVIVMTSSFSIFRAFYFF